jgi:ATP-dependent DNA ligase
MNGSFPDIVEAVAAVPGDFIWDAELTVDEPTGQSSFERLQVRARTTVATRVRAVRDSTRLACTCSICSGRGNMTCGSCR